MPFDMEKLEWLGYPTVKNEYTFIRLDRIHERDRQTDIQTPRDSIGCVCTASRGKNGLQLIGFRAGQLTFYQETGDSRLSVVVGPSSFFLSFIAYSTGALLCPQYVAIHLE